MLKQFNFHSGCKQPTNVVFLHSTENHMLFVGQVKGQQSIFFFSVGFNYIVAVKINISNGSCLKQEIQAILQMLILADKLKFFCVASFKCCLHLPLDCWLAGLFLTACKISRLTCYECLLYQVTFKSSAESYLVNKTLDYSLNMFWWQTTNLNFE